MAKQYTYIPLLRPKVGELAALHNLSAAGRTNVRPLILLQPEQYAETKAPPRKPRKKPLKTAPAPAADIFCRQIQHAWGAEELFLDASELPSGTGRHQIVNIAAVARRLGIKLVPATTLSAPDPYQEAVRRQIVADGRGVGLRITLAEMTSSARWTKSWMCSLSETDLIVDLGNGATTVSALGVTVARTFDDLHRARDWRSVTIAGSSMPQNFSGFPVGTRTIDRTEWNLWGDLAAHDLPYRIDFGDYATVAVDLMRPGVRWGYPINAKYTLNNKFLICHGVRTKGEGSVLMAPQLVGHAQKIVAWKGRGALPHCWGDTQIDRIASGTLEPGGLPGWVRFSVNRHIELTRSALP